MKNIYDFNAELNNNDVREDRGMSVITFLSILVRRTEARISGKMCYQIGILLTFICPIRLQTESFDSLITLP